MNYGGLKIANPRGISEAESPDCRNEIIAGNRLKTRPGIAKDFTIALPNPIYFMLNPKSGFCKEDYNLAIDNSGNIIIDPKNYWSDYTAITNCEELQAMQDDLDGKYYLANDIDVTDCTQDPNGALYNGGAGFAPITAFTGTLDGRNHTITGMKINRVGSQYVGLFSKFYGTVKNLGLINVDITALDETAALTGYNYGIITNCYATGVINGGGGTVGGLGGQNKAGGVVTKCYCTCQAISNYKQIGGLFGVNEGSVSDCYATGTVSSGKYIGGLIGENSATASITNCYSIGVVNGSVEYIGGLVGRNYGGPITNCFWDTETSGQASSAGGTGKTTAEMKQQATFTNWDFSSIWDITETITYPWLR